MNKTRVKRACLVLAVSIIFIQIFQPARTNPPAIPSRSLWAHVAVPPAVRSALIGACGDCHSDQTTWPWYSRIAPLSWIVIDDVNQGRRNMNFDDWEAQENAKRANEHVADICPEIRRKGMPPFSYRILHGGNQVAADQITPICAWSNSFKTP